MKKYTITVSWSVSGQVEVEADSIEEAVEIAMDLNPTQVDRPEYVEDSWFVEQIDSEEEM